MNGMPKFAQISDDDLDTIRFYLRTRSKQAPAEWAALQAKLAAGARK
jgi:quinohemoprotein ethanol dehydrogenase